MSDSQLRLVLRDLRKFSSGKDKHERRLQDGALLERFVQVRDESAFEELMTRHGPMVLDVCRRVLHNSSAVEDAFQATFLVLLRKASSIRRGELLANWLYGVAYRVSCRANVEAAKRRARERAVPARDVGEPSAELTARELFAALHEELNALPSRCRSALVLCYLENCTRADVACQSGCSLATLDRRLERGRALLKVRLGRRGLTSGLVLLPIMLSQASASILPTSLAASTMRAVAAGTGAAGASPGAIALTEGVLKAMFLAKLKTTAAIVTMLVALVGVSIGAVVFTRQADAGPPAAAQENNVQEQPAPPAVVQANKVQEQPDARYFIWAVQTDLQRELMPRQDVYVVLDGTAALAGGKVSLRELKLEDLRKALLPYKKADSKVQFSLSFDRIDVDDLDERDHQNALRYALIGYGYEMGFAKVTAYQAFHNAKTSWKDRSGGFLGKRRQPKGDEKPMGNDLVKVFPVRTEFSRSITGDADCVVFFRASLEKEKGTIPQKVRDAVIDAVDKLQLPHRKRVNFIVTDFLKLGNDERQQLLNDCNKLAEEMKFEGNSVGSG